MISVHVKMIMKGEFFLVSAFDLVMSPLFITKAYPFHNSTTVSTVTKPFRGGFLDKDYPL